MPKEMLKHQTAGLADSQCSSITGLYGKKCKRGNKYAPDEVILQR
jgi:hypothetical protein